MTCSRGIFTLWLVVLCVSARAADLPVSADGGGPSLERIYPGFAGRSVTYWGASELPGGTPGRLNSRTAEFPEPSFLPGISAGMVLLGFLASVRRKKARRSRGE